MFGVFVDFVAIVTFWKRGYKDVDTERPFWTLLRRNVGDYDGVEWALQVARGMAALEAQAIIHRELRSPTVLLVGMYGALLSSIQ